ncbi:hypothetical protein BJ741DRAFT_609951 [Chytriomyces cf. hyalinus JEL632]|nr:hypothetical protein BJ741DRAFT_609951 [Chytriomyces cf. hyalinus JEL632]
MLALVLLAGFVHGQGLASQNFDAGMAALPVCAQQCVTAAVAGNAGSDLRSAVCLGAPQSQALQSATDCAILECVTQSDVTLARAGFNNLASACSVVLAPSPSAPTGVESTIPTGVIAPPAGISPLAGAVTAIPSTTSSPSTSATRSAAPAVWTGCIMTSGAYLIITHPLTGSAFSVADPMVIQWSLGGVPDPAFSTLSVSFEVADASNQNNVVKANNGDLSLASTLKVGDLKAETVVPNVVSGKNYTLRSVITDPSGVKNCFSPQFSVAGKAGASPSSLTSAAANTLGSAASAAGTQVSTKANAPASAAAGGVSASAAVSKFSIGTLLLMMGLVAFV